MYTDPARWSLTFQTYVQLTMLQSHLQAQVSIANTHNYLHTGPTYAFTHRDAQAFSSENRFFPTNIKSINLILNLN